jgi:hypothetical protein
MNALADHFDEQARRFDLLEMTSSTQGSAGTQEAVK